MSLHLEGGQFLNTSGIVVMVHYFFTVPYYLIG